MATPFRNTSGQLVGDGGASELDFSDLALRVVSKFIDVLEAVAIIVVGLFVIRMVRRYIQKIEVAHETQRTALNLLEKITTGFLTVVLFTLALKVVGLDITLLVSAALLGLSFGLKDVAKNYIAGLLILFKSPFEIGDIVKIRKYVGSVEKIEFQYITMRTFDRKEVTVHNADVLTQPIVNYTKEKVRRIEIEMLFGYGTDLFRVNQILEKILDGHPKILKKPKWSSQFKKFTKEGMAVSFRFYVERPCNILKIRYEVAMQFAEAFEEAKILMPFGREVQLQPDYGNTPERRHRSELFYAQPALAAVVSSTNGQVHNLFPEPEVGVLEDEAEPEEY